VSYVEVDGLATKVTRANFGRLLRQFSRPEDMVGQTINVEINDNPFDPNNNCGAYVEPPNNEEDNVSTFDPDFYDRQAAAMLEKAEQLRGIPQADVFPDGTVLTFSKTFFSQGTAPSESEYHYVAIKSAGLWHVSGDKSPNNAFWMQLLQFIGIRALQTVKILDAEGGVPLKEYAEKVTKALEGTVEETK
jgi:hypothetical protein